MQNSAKNPWWFSFTSNVLPKVLFGVLFMIQILAVFGWQTLTFNTADRIPEFIIIDAAKQREFGAFTVKVQTGLFIKNFPSFDMIKNNFTVDCLVWFEFYPDEIMLDTVQKFSFENGKIVQKSPPDIKIEQGKALVTYDVRVEFKSNLRYDRFPLEDHRISLILTNNFVTPSEMIFEVSSNAFRVSPAIFISNWALKDISTDSGYSISKLDDQEQFREYASPRAAFTMSFQKSGFRKVLIIFLPLFFAIFFSFLSFMMNDINTVGRYYASVTAVTSLIGYRFVIEQMMPEVGYFTIADSIYIALLIAALASFIFQIFFARWVDSINLAPPEEQKIAYQRASLVNTVAYFLISIGLALMVFICLF